jgi:hypothetical protein
LIPHRSPSFTGKPAKPGRRHRSGRQWNKLLHTCSFHWAAIAAGPVSGYNSQPDGSSYRRFVFSSSKNLHLVGIRKDGQLPIFFLLNRFMGPVPDRELEIIRAVV